MNKLQNRFRSELTMSPKAFLTIILFINIIFVYAVQSFFVPYPLVDQAYSFYLVVVAYALLGLLLDFWSTTAARWFTAAGLALIILFVSQWLHLPEVLLLLPIAVLLMAVMVSFVPASLFGAVITLVVLIGWRMGSLHMTQPVFLLFVIALWSTLGIVYAAMRRYQQLNGWLVEDYDKSRVLLDEARSQKLELAQTLESLTNANRQLAQANKRMAVLSQIAEDAQKAKSTFVANVSHEFRTPLNMIIGLIDLMTRSPENYDVVLSPKMREDFSVIARNCEHLSNMINDVLDLTRVETGRLTLYREWVDLPGIIQKCVTVVQPLMEKKSLTLEIVLPPELPSLYCDRTRIQQVILNLLSNAARFTEKGGITIRVSQENQMVNTMVMDTGSGIATEDSERIFEPFWQGKDQAWQKKGGSGLGLALSREFVILHGGQMWFESEVGKGTCFFFSLPASPFTDPVTRAGHFIKEDWVWRENAFKSGQSASSETLIRPRVLLYDETGTLHARFEHYADRVEFYNIHDLNQIPGNTPAQAMVINSTSLEKLCAMMETASNAIHSTPLIGVSVPGEFTQAFEHGAAGYLIKPLKMEDIKRVLDGNPKPVTSALIVDDDSDVLGLYERMLRACDPKIRVRTANSGKAALSAVREAPPDLLLLDIVMPEMNGWQVLHELNCENLLQTTAVHFVTAQDPADQLVSNFFLTTIKGGISLNKILRCSLDVSTLLMEPEREPGLARSQNLPDEPALK